MVFDRRLLSSPADPAPPPNLYVSRHGIAFQVPEGWIFGDLEEVARTRERMSLDDDALNEAWHEVLRETPEHEAFVVVRDMRSAHHVPDATSPDVEHLAVGVAVHYEGTYHDTDDEEPFSLAEHVREDLEMFSAALRDYRVVKAPRRILVSGREAVEYTAQFSYVHADLPRPVGARERVIYVYRRPHVYSIRMFDFPELDPPLCHDFDEFVTTLRVL